jgi:hypothetical protein
MVDKTFIRGVRVIHEPYTPPPHVEHLRYSLDVFDERENLVEVLGRLADLAVAHAAYPDKRLFLRERARVLRRYDEPGG